MFDWPGNSEDLTPIEEVWNIMKKKSGKLPKNKIKLWNNICNLWYGIHKETVNKLYDEMSPMVEAVRKAKMGVPCTDGVKVENENELLYDTTHTDK